MGFINKEEIFVGEYSKEQNAYHITTFDNSVKTNLEMYINKNMNGYMPICYGNTYEEVADKLDKIRELYPWVDETEN